jgi:hypothetical protein
MIKNSIIIFTVLTITLAFKFGANIEKNAFDVGK